MPPEFSDLVVGSTEFSITAEVHDMFLGDHIGSMIEYCRLVMIPTRATGYWSLYMWDMKETIVHVLDPVIKSIDPEEMWALHGGFIKRIGKAMNTCRETLLKHWNVDFEKFPEQFLVIEQHPADCSESGL
ncbi:unnamed protein product [Urochloa humidicola]